MQVNLINNINIPFFFFIIISVTMILSTLTSNTATSALVIPIAGNAAIAMDLHPYGPILSACMAASCAFILPVSSPPNAMVHDDKYVTIRKMALAGVILSVISTVLITLFIVLYLPIVWDINLAGIPDWAIPSGP